MNANKYPHLAGAIAKVLQDDVYVCGPPKVDADQIYQALDNLLAYEKLKTEDFIAKLEEVRGQ